MKLINGQKYSISQFNNYKLRLQIRVQSNQIILPGSPYPKESLLEFYTDEECIDEAKLVITEDIFTDKITSWNFEHIATKEQDDAMSVFLAETLREY